MIITCPSCSTKLSLEDSMIRGKQVKVRCASCQHIFTAGPAPEPSQKADDLDLSLDLPGLPDLEEGLGEAMSKSPADDLSLDLPDLSDLASGLMDEGPEPSAPSPPPPPRPQAPPRKAAPPPPPPPLDDDMSLGDLGELDSGDIATGDEPLGGMKEPDSGPESLGGLGELDSGDLATGDESLGEDLGELSDLDLEIEGALGDELGAEPLEEDTAAMDMDLSLDLPGLDEEPAAAGGGDELDLDLDLPGLEEEAPKPKVADEPEDEQAVANALAELAPEGEEISLDLPDSPGLDATMELEEPDLSEPTDELELPTSDLGELSDLDLEAPAGGGVALDEELSLDDFELEDTADLAPRPAEEAEAAAPPEPEPTMDLELGSSPGLADDELGDLGDLDLDVSPEDLGTKEITPAAPAEPGEELDISLDDLAPEPEPEARAKPDKPAMDLDFDMEETMDMNAARAAMERKAAEAAAAAPQKPDMQSTVAMEKPYTETVAESPPMPEEPEDIAPEEVPEEDLVPEPTPPPPQARPGGFSAGRFIAFLVAILVVAGVGLFALDFFGVIHILPSASPPEVVAPPDTEGSLHLIVTDVEGRKEKNAVTGNIVSVRGHLKNAYPGARDNMQIYAELYDADGNEIAREWAYAGNPISVSEMRTLSEDSLAARFSNQAGMNDTNKGVAPGKSLPFSVIFFEVPDNATEFSVRPIHSDAPGAGKPLEG